MVIKKTPELLRNIDKINMDIYEMAYVRVGTDWRASHVRSGYTRIYMIIDGYGTIIYEGTELIMEPGNIYVIPAGLDFSYKCDGFMEKIYFHISILLPNNYDVFDGVSKCMRIQNKRESIIAISKLIKTNTINSVIGIKAFLYEVVRQCIQSEGDAVLTSYSDNILNILGYIEANLSSGLSISQIADYMFVSPSKLQKLFKAELGIPIGRYIDDRLMFISEREVRHGTMSIKEISDMLGFCDQFYFSRRFSIKYGMPPQKYRNALCGS